MGASLGIERPPQTDRELWHFVRAVFGITIPNTKVCPNHVPPFKLFADAYFARYPVIVLKGSRGLAGKSWSLATLANVMAVGLAAQTTILGGSGAQSTNVHLASQAMWAYPHAPRGLIAGEPTKYETHLTNGAWIRSLMASQTSVRGPHPNRLILDEIDEMDLDILEAAQGQPMRGKHGNQKGIETCTVMCLAGHSLVLTQRGEVRIESVMPTDLVMTRRGWASLRAVTMSGFKPVVDVVLSNGRTLTCTDDHRIAVPGGWMTPAEMSVGQPVVGVRADLVVGQPGHDGASLPGFVPSVLLPTPEPVTGPALTPLPVGPDVLGRVGVPLRTVGLRGVQGAGGLAPEDVLPRRNDLQMVGVATRPVPAQMVEVLAVGDGADQHQVGEPVDVGSRHQLPVDHPVPPGRGPVPDPAAVDLGGPVEEPVTVVAIIDRCSAHVPVYDLSVNGPAPEFVAEGIVVHNSSTHQYADGTMTAILDRAEERGWPVYEVCYRENMNAVDGWLTPDEVERKRSEIPIKMWQTEYELQEPSIEGRAIDTDAVERTFDPELGLTEGNNWVDLDFAERRAKNDALPAGGGREQLRCVTGVDWAKRQDRTVITTFFLEPGGRWRCVAWSAMSRMPWPAMVAAAEERFRTYPEGFAHDATGLGDVIRDYFDGDLRRRYQRTFKDVIMGTGRARADLFNDYISAIENDLIRYPRISSAYRAHLYLTWDDLYGSGHPPDEFVAGAIAWSLRPHMQRGGLALPLSMEKSEPSWSGV